MSFSVPGLRRPESCSHSRQRCEHCLERSFSQLTVRRAQKTMTRSCSDNTNSHHHHNRCLTIHSLHNAHHNPSIRVHSLDAPKVERTTGFIEVEVIFLDVWWFLLPDLAFYRSLSLSLWRTHGLTTDYQHLCILMKTTTSHTTLLLPTSPVSRPWIWPSGATRYHIHLSIQPSIQNRWKIKPGN